MFSTHNEQSLLEQRVFRAVGKQEDMMVIGKVADEQGLLMAIRQQPEQGLAAARGVLAFLSKRGQFSNGAQSEKLSLRYCPACGDRPSAAVGAHGLAAAAAGGKRAGRLGRPGRRAGRC